MRRLGGLGATGSRVTRRTIVAAGAAGASASLAAACGAGQREAAQAPKAQGPASVKLTYRLGQEVFFDELAATFMQREPQVKVTTEGFPGNEYFTKLDVLFAGGSQSDLTWVSSIEAYFDHTARGNFLAIDPYIKSDRVDLKEWFGGAVEMLRVKSGLYALPLWSHPSSVALYYNKDLFASESVPVPDGTWSHEQTVEYARRLTRRTGSAESDRYGYWPSVAFYNGLCQAVRAFGGTVMSPDGTRMTMTAPQTREAVQWLADLYLRHQVAPPANANLNQLWDSGRLAMRLQLYGTRRDAITRPWPVTWGANLGPKGRSGTYGAELQTDSAPIARQSKVVDAAWLFHRFLSSKDSGLVIAKSATPGARPDVWSHPDLAKDETHQPFFSVMQTAPPIPRPANARLLELLRDMGEATAPMWRGETSVADGLAEAQRRGQAILDKPPPG